MLTFPTLRDGVSVTVDLAGPPALHVIGANYTASQLRYLRDRMAGADLLSDVGTRVIAHRLGTLTVHVDRRAVGRHLPSTQALADYTTSALEA